MDVAESDTPAFVIKIIESKQFKKAVEEMIDRAIDNISADQIDGLADEVESVINHGTFETTFTT